MSVADANAKYALPVTFSDRTASGKMQVSNAGAVGRTPEQIRQSLIDYATLANPGYTAHLPGSLIEDLVSTQVPGISQCEQASIDALSSISVTHASDIVLTALGAERGIYYSEFVRTQVDLYFQGTPGYPIPAGFIVKDSGASAQQYAVNKTTIIPAGGYVYATATCTKDSYTFAFPNTITVIVSSLPAGITLSVTNPNNSITGSGYELLEDFRAKVLDALAAPQEGSIKTLRTELSKIPNNQPRLTTIQASGAGIRVIVGGGDDTAIAEAIYRNVFALNSLLFTATTDSTRNKQVTVVDTPDTYAIKWVTPQQQSVTVALTYTTTNDNFVSNSTIIPIARSAILNYINAIYVTKPLSLLEIRRVFIAAVESYIDNLAITNIDIVITISTNGSAYVTTAPTAGSSVINAAAEAYWITTSNNITITKG